MVHDSKNNYEERKAKTIKWLRWKFRRHADDCEQEFKITCWQYESSNKVYDPALVIRAAKADAIDSMISAKYSRSYRGKFSHTSFPANDYAPHGPASVSICRDSCEKDIIDRMSIQEAMNTLAAHERMLIIAHDIQDLTQDEIAEMLGRDRSTISRQLTTIRNKLRALLEADHGETSNDRKV